MSKYSVAAQSLVGKRHGRLRIASILDARHPQTGGIVAMCDCDCGQRKPILISRLKQNTVSCGCQRSESASARQFKHGHTCGYHPSPEYRCWRAMIARCENPSSQHYSSYGGRGISVCTKWRSSFEAFLKDMGPRPSLKHSLDRFPNNDGNYEPGNCRWATQTQQCRNTRKNTVLSFQGKSHCVSEWAEITGIDIDTLLGRLRLGWDAEKTLTAPKRKLRPRQHR